MDQEISIDIVDTHVHARQKPGGEYVYNFHAEEVLHDLGTGGVSMVHEMPNTKPPLITYEEMQTRIHALRGEKNYGGVYFCYNGGNLAELQKCLSDITVRPFVVGVKIYPATQGSGNVTTNFGAGQDMYEFSLQDGSPLCQIATFCSEQGIPITIHCEDPEEKAQIGKAYGTFDDSTEPDFIERIILHLCEKYPHLKLIVAHISHKKTTELLQHAWNQGAENLYAEITPHHLLLTTEEIQQSLGTDAVFGFCHPFVKIATEHRDAIQRLLCDGRYQNRLLYGSDHAPHAEEAKRRGLGGVPNHQGPQIVLAWFRSLGFEMNDPLVQKFFSLNAQRVFTSVPGWMEWFKQQAGSILFLPAKYGDGSIPERIHNKVVVNPWSRLVGDEIKAHWVAPKHTDFLS